MSDNITQSPDLRIMSLGEKRVRTNFNVTASGVVDQIKQDAAKSIDYIEDRKKEYVNKCEINGSPIDSETLRLFSLAQTGYEEAAMWAVKAVTA